MKRALAFLALASLLVFWSSPRAVTASATEALTVGMYDLDGTLVNSFQVETANAGGGAVVAAADLGTDGTDEIVIGNGLGSSPQVTVYRRDGSEVGHFLAYDVNMGAGITLAVCDLDNDGINDIVTGTQFGGGPHIRTFTNMGMLKMGGGFFAYSEGFRGGVNVACGDVDGDGQTEIITGAGPTGGPHVRIWGWSGGGWQVENEFFAFDGSVTTGVNVAIAHEAAGTALIVSNQTGSNPVVSRYVIHSQVTEQSRVAGTFFNGETPVAGDTSGTGIDEVLSTSNGDGTTTIERGNGERTILAEAAGRAVSFAIANLDDDAAAEIVAVRTRALSDASLPEGKYIRVNVTDQRLYAYESGVLVNTFLVSTGKPGFETPRGVHSVLAKLPYVDYTWSYGVGDPRNYSLGLVPYNLRIYPHIYIHYAYWHDNFGHKMSHGCVNVNLVNIKWIYDWAEVGIPVEVFD